MFPHVSFVGKGAYPLMHGRELSRKAPRNASRASFVYREVMKLHWGQGWFATRLLLRSLFFSMALASLPVLYLMNHGNICGRAGYGDGCILASDQAAIKGPFQRLSVLGNGEEFSTMQSQYSTMSYEEYIQLQLKKTQSLKLMKFWSTKAWRQKVGIFSELFQSLLNENLLKIGDKGLCIGAGAGEEVMALKESGVQDAVGIDLTPSLPLVIKGDAHKLPFADNMFDFEFSNIFDHAISPALFVAEIERTLKEGGIAAMHVSLGTWRDKFLSSGGQTIDPITLLFKKSEIVYVTKADVSELDTMIVFRKRFRQDEKGIPSHGNKSLLGKCPIFKQREAIIGKLEPLIMEEPGNTRASWEDHLQNMRYLPDLVDVRKHRRQLYVDVGAGDMNASIGSWFYKQYPRNGKRYEIFAWEADESLAASFTGEQGVQFLPYAAWIRNESLELRKDMVTDVIELEKRGLEGKEERRKVEGLDFADWLKNTAAEDDFVVVKMDAKGAEFYILSRMFETGAICLVDELFLECHYDRRWTESGEGWGQNYKREYGECVALFEMLRDKGVVVHQWWK